jgi:hypothetical protein
MWAHWNDERGSRFSTAPLEEALINALRGAYIALEMNGSRILVV